MLMIGNFKTTVSRLRLTGHANLPEGLGQMDASALKANPAIASADRIMHPAAPASTGR